MIAVTRKSEIGIDGGKYCTCAIEAVRTEEHPRIAGERKRVQFHEIYERQDEVLAGVWYQTV